MNDLMESHSQEYLQSGVYSTSTAENNFSEVKLANEVQKAMNMKPTMSDVDAIIRYQSNQKNNSVEIWPTNLQDSDAINSFNPADLKTLLDPSSTQ